MIEFKKAYVVGGQVFATLEQAQEHELGEMLAGIADCGEDGRWTVDAIAVSIAENKDRVIDILTTTPTSKPRARRINGGKKTRKASPEAVNAALQDGKQ